MKHFIRDILFVLCFLVLVTSLFQGISSKKEETIESSLSQFEENINKGEIIENNTYIESKKGIEETSNIFGKIGYVLTNFVISIINGIIKIVLFIIQKIV